MVAQASQTHEARMTYKIFAPSTVSQIATLYIIGAADLMICGAAVGAQSYLLGVLTFGFGMFFVWRATHMLDKASLITMTAPNFGMGES